MALLFLFTFRVQIKDWYLNLTKDPVPEPISFEEVSSLEGDLGDVSDLGDVINETEGVEGLDSVSDEIENVGGDEVILPSEFNLDVPFTSQAPHANWGLPYQEACEEASVLMVHAYYEDLSLSVDMADEMILEIVDYEEDALGFYKDTTAEETSQLIKGLYGYQKVVLILDPTVEDIKTHIAAGRPVIVPAAGQELGNPNFTSPGPIYHMLIIKGYTETSFITNDPGTRNGEDYVYKYDTIMNAIHDWNDGDVDNGEQIIIIIYPNP